MLSFVEITTFVTCDRIKSYGGFGGFFVEMTYWYGPGKIMDICVVRVRLVLIDGTYKKSVITLI